VVKKDTTPVAEIPEAAEEEEYKEPVPALKVGTRVRVLVPSRGIAVYTLGRNPLGFGRVYTRRVGGETSKMASRSRDEAFLNQPVINGQIPKVERELFGTVDGAFRNTADGETYTRIALEGRRESWIYARDFIEPI